MKKIILGTVIALSLSTPSYAWWDSYGGFTCGYMDPLTSFLDDIFGPPCPPPAPVAVVQAPPIVIEKRVPVPVPQPYAVPVPQPYAVPVPQPVPQPIPVPVYPYPYY